tara:strand:- start:7 stop:717 length:711 start_codon:yes stop_codon:yes gene_type:complete
MDFKISIIIPFYNEAETVTFLIKETKAQNPTAEIIAINDGSSDDTLEHLKKIPNIRILNTLKNRGQSSALYAGLTNATGDIIVTMDGDGQNDPSDIPKLAEALSPEIGMVCGFRSVRKDILSKRIASKIGNFIRRTFIQDGIRDTGCSLKCFRKESVQYLVPFNGMHRFMAAAMQNAGLKIIEVPVNHRERYAGRSKYTNWERAIRGLYDLIGVSWLLNRQVRSDLYQVSDTEEVN